MAGAGGRHDHPADQRDHRADRQPELALEALGEGHREQSRASTDFGLSAGGSLVGVCRG
jgi:hypothetical protein